MWVATAVIGAGASIYGSNKAAETQSANAKRVADMQMQQYGQTREDLSPYRAVGEDASGRLTSRLSELTQGISVNPDDFQNSDYYKFLDQQGQRAVTNAAAARGLGSSGAALKGAAAFSKGLSSQEWQNNFNMKRANQSDAYSRLKGLIDTGASAATGTAAAGQTATTNAGTALTGGANAEAGNYLNIGKQLSGLAGNIGGYAAYQGMYGNSGGGNSGANVFNTSGSGGAIY